MFVQRVVVDSSCDEPILLFVWNCVTVTFAEETSMPDISQYTASYASSESDPPRHIETLASIRATAAAIGNELDATLVDEDSASCMKLNR